MQYCDVCIGNEEDADKCLGFKSEGTNVTEGNLNIDGYKKIFTQMKEKFGFKYIATTLRESHSSTDNGWSALIYNGNDFYQSRKYDIHIVDRVGGGDSFAAGLIHGLVTNMDYKKAVDFAVAASALKHTIPGDFSYSSEKEVMALVKGDSSGRVQR
jgi:2-dehydro-3-deoxygluconokinase